MFIKLFFVLIFCLLTCQLLLAQENCKSDGERIVCQPSPITDKIYPNPFQGFVSYSLNLNYGFPVSTLFTDITWAELQPNKEDEIDIIKLENLLNQIKDKEWARIAFRIVIAQPNSPQDFKPALPSWLVEKCSKKEQNFIRADKFKYFDGAMSTDNEMLVTVPNWDSPCLLEAHESLLKKLSEQLSFDKIAWIDIGSYGFFGEWHHDNQPKNNPIAFEGKKATLKKIIDSYFQYFPKTQLLIAFDNLMASKYVLGNSKGLRYDCLGLDNSYFEERMKLINQDCLTEKCQDVNPLSAGNLNMFGGEFCIDDERKTQLLKQAKKNNGLININSLLENYHWSWLGGNGIGVFLSEAKKDKKVFATFEKLYRTLGYHFRIKEISHEKSISVGQKLNVTFQLENTGNAPFFYNWKAYLYFIKDDGKCSTEKKIEMPWDLKKWFKGINSEQATVIVPTLSKGKYLVGLAIENPQTNKPAIRFENKGACVEYKNENTPDDPLYVVSNITIN